MAHVAEKAQAKSILKADEVREFEKGRVELVHIAGSTVGRATFEPGWKWSTCVKPIAGTRSCDSAHFGYQISGTMIVVMDDGSKMTVRPGDVVSIPPGHDAWVEGKEPVVVLDFQGMVDYARKR
jgi:mannose-6-phosphate isomerase-like protein (cupin superfamily)